MELLFTVSFLSLADREPILWGPAYSGKLLEIANLDQGQGFLPSEAVVPVQSCFCFCFCSFLKSKIESLRTE